MIDSAFVTLLFILYPGMIGTSIYRLLVVHRQMSQFEFIPLALIFSVLAFFVDALLSHFTGFILQLWPSGNDVGFNVTLTYFILSPNFYIITAMGIIQGFVSAYIMNTGRLFAWLRKEIKLGFFNFDGFTRKTGFVDVWQDFFLANQGKWIEVVTKREGRVFLGFPEDISDFPTGQNVEMPGSRELYLKNCREIVISDQGEKKEIILGDVYFTGDEIAWVIAHPVIADAKREKE